MLCALYFVSVPLLRSSGVHFLTYRRAGAHAKEHFIIFLFYVLVRSKRFLAGAARLTSCYRTNFRSLSCHNGVHNGNTKGRAKRCHNNISINNVHFLSSRQLAPIRIQICSAFTRGSVSTSQESSSPPSASQHLTIFERQTNKQHQPTPPNGH